MLTALGTVLAAGGCTTYRASSTGDNTAWDPPQSAANAQLFVVKRGWHLDVGFAVQELTPTLSRVEAQLPQARYLLFGFGDRRYLTARSKRLDALLAALQPGAALILLTGLPDTPQDAFGAQNVQTLRISGTQMQAAQSFIWRTLAHSRGQPVRVQSGPYAGSTYLAALPRYSALHTCNSWAAEALRAAGLPARTGGVLFAWQLWIQMPRLQRAERRLRTAGQEARGAQQ